jgi:hypothetical protein
MQLEITRLKKELSSKGNIIPPKIVDNPKLAETVKAQKEEIAQLKQQNVNQSKMLANTSKSHSLISKSLVSIQKSVSTLIDFVDAEPEIKKEAPSSNKGEYTYTPNKGIITFDKPFTKAPKLSGSGAKRILVAACQFYPNPISKARIGAITGLSFKSGSFSTYLSSLRQSGYITGSGDEIYATEDGLQHVGEYEPLPTDPEKLIEYWCGVVGGSPARILQLIFENHPNGLTNEEIGEQLTLSHKSGSFSTYMSSLRSKNLIYTSNKKNFITKEIIE